MAKTKTLMTTGMLANVRLQILLCRVLIGKVASMLANFRIVGETGGKVANLRRMRFVRLPQNPDL